MKTVKVCPFHSRQYYDRHNFLFMHALCTNQLHPTWLSLTNYYLTYRAVLALYAGAVESEGGDTMADPLDVEDTFIASLARLGLWQVLGLQGYWLHLPSWDQNLLRGHQLGTVLEGENTGRRAQECQQSRKIKTHLGEKVTGKMRRTTLPGDRRKDRMMRGSKPEK